MTRMAIAVVLAALIVSGTVLAVTFRHHDAHHCKQVGFITQC